MSTATYHSLTSLIETYMGGIEIPILQRDYAQGRNNRQSVRSEFLDNLIDCLNKESAMQNSTLVLDFIYGYSESEKESSKFIPLDGQQRLTTLFLLHLYCHQYSEIDFFENNQVLTYNTRASSLKFCRKLEVEGFKLLRNGKFVKQIIDSSWFSNSWLKDPTVKGMLVILDDLDKRLSQKDLAKYWKRLTEDHCIQFLVKDINDKENKISPDNLYIKMNARGKPLSEFENFKSFIDALVQKECPDIYTEWIGKIDHLWTDLFWKHRNTADKNPEEIGDEFMRFFKSMLYDKLLLLGEKSFVEALPEVLDDSLVSFYELYNKDEDNLKKGSKIYQELIKQLSNDSLIPNLIYKNLKLFDAELIKRIYNILNRFAESLEEVINETETLSFNILSQKLDNSESFERNIFQSVITGRTTFQNRLLFFTLCEVLLKKCSLNETYEKLRTIRNLIENRAYNNVNEYVEGIKAINEILSFDNVLVSLADESNPIRHFEKVQIEEERNKARILLSPIGDQWRDSIIKAENNEYLLGQISYLFNFAEIDDYNFPNLRNLELFDKYHQISSKFFDYNVDNKDTFYIQRALLCFGNYLISFGGNRWCFLTTTKDRDTTFKRLLLNTDKRMYFKQLLDELKPDESISEQLFKIINQDKPTDIEDWRKQIIESDYILKNIGNYRLLEFKDEENQIIHLITGSNNGWKHSELNTFDLYLRFSNDKKNMVFDVIKWKLDYYHSSSNDISCMVFNQLGNANKIAIDIHYEDYSEIGCKYRISLFCRNLYGQERKNMLEDFFKDKLTDFRWAENDFFRYENFYDDVSSCILDIQKLVN